MSASTPERPPGLQSMTGFARIDGAAGDMTFAWELKSVNARGLEARFRTPPGFDAFEAKLRAVLSKHVARGSVSATLNVDTGARTGAKLRANEDALSAAIGLVNEVRMKVDCEKPRAEGILALKGVLEFADVEISQEAIDTLKSAAAGAFEECASELGAARRQEGVELHRILSDRLDALEGLVSSARADESGAPKSISARIGAQIAELIDADTVPAERVAQEAAMLAVKADIREELDRLDAHVAAARALLSENAPVGRRLDFLTQELNREANTLCAKAASMALKEIGLEMKAIVDQVREQVQNVE